MESMAVVELNTQVPMEKKGETRVEITRRTSGLTDGGNLAPAIKLDRDDVPHRVSLPYPPLFIFHSFLSFGDRFPPRALLFCYSSWFARCERNTRLRIWMIQVLPIVSKDTSVWYFTLESLFNAMRVTHGNPLRKFTCLKISCSRTWHFLIWSVEKNM